MPNNPSNTLNDGSSDDKRRVRLVERQIWSDLQTHNKVAVKVASQATDSLCVCVKWR